MEAKSKAELLKMAEETGLKNYKSKNKTELIALLTAPKKSLRQIQTLLLKMKKGWHF